MSNTDVKQYGIQYQLYLLSQVFSNPEIFVRCKNILRAEYFDKEYHPSIEYIHEYSQKYSEVPPLVDVKFKAGFEYDDIKVTELHQGAVLDSVAEFCRHKALALAVQKSMELVHQKKYGGIEELIREAQLVTIQNELGLDIYEDPENVIKSLANMQGTFKTGWETLDYKLFGGFGRQELEIFAAASGGGKSVVLQNLAVNFTKNGLNGAYITLELAAELVAVRIYGMMANVAQAQIKSDAESAAFKIKMEGQKNGELRIHRLPESVSTTNDIESYVRELQIKTGIKLDYVCVDYLDLLTSDRCGPNDKSNAFVKDKFVSEELRALAMKMDLTVFTACQFNRSGVQEDKKSQSQIAGGISKIYTADNVIYIEARKEQGEMWFDFQKTRNSSAVGSRLRMSYDMHSLRVLDHALTVQQMELDGGFKHSGSCVVGGGDVVSAPSTMQMLRRDLSNRTTTQPVEEVVSPPDSTETSYPEVSETDGINTKNEISSSNQRISNMRDFLTRRK